jgi:hypothetical protein
MRGLLSLSAIGALVAIVGCVNIVGSVGRAAAAPKSAQGAAAPDRWGTVWLCRPGLANNPCAHALTTTVVGPTGASKAQRQALTKRPAIDCFYVYPSVSPQSTINANLQIDPQERDVAIAQASRFSQVCRVYAPMYPQLTLKAVLTPGGITVAAAVTAYAGVLTAFRNYLAHYNHGRGIVFIGHSQGASMLVGLLQQEVDPSPAVRRRLVSALIVGGNVTVPRGRTVGGDFKHIPECRSTRQTGCVVAYSSFDQTPPSDSYFGRVGTGLNPFKHTATKGLQVMCVNPASPKGGSGALLPYFPTSSSFPTPSITNLQARSRGLRTPSTPWVSYPREYSARCESRAGATWLQVTLSGGSRDRRPVVKQFEGPIWGLHVFDVNLALGNLVGLVADEASSERP